jgi:quinol-cytochrome oxidoreductase complex cytochrome b subunit
VKGPDEFLGYELYTAYAMILLVFMHMMRGYFVSVHKPRELMRVTGMLMGFVTLGLGFTGYLLPWTVVSKSATDVGAGLISALPRPLSNFLSFLVVCAGEDSAELLRFFDLHVIVLPADPHDRTTGWRLSGAGGYPRGGYVLAGSAVVLFLMFLMLLA